MKSSFKILIIVIISLTFFAACTQAPAPTEEPSTDPVPTEPEIEIEDTEETADETDPEVPTEEAIEVTEEVDEIQLLIVDRCSGCHSVTRVFSEDGSAAEWETIIDRMIGYGAVVSDEEKEQMIDWLASRED